MMKCSAHFVIGVLPVSIPNKPVKYSLKIFALANVKTFYMHNMEVYAGKQPEDSFKISNIGKDVVEKLFSQFPNWVEMLWLITDICLNHWHTVY